LRGYAGKVGMMPWKHVSDSSNMLVAIPIFFYCAGEYQTQSTSAIHEYFAHTESPDFCFDDQSSMTLFWDRYRMISFAKQDALRRPVDVLWNICHSTFFEVDFLRELLHLSSGNTSFVNHAHMSSWWRESFIRVASLNLLNFVLRWRWWWIRLLRLACLIEILHSMNCR
jgi:hypothetical protein